MEKITKVSKTLEKGRAALANLEAAEMEGKILVPDDPASAAVTAVSIFLNPHLMNWMYFQCLLDDEIEALGKEHSEKSRVEIDTSIVVDDDVLDVDVLPSALFRKDLPEPPVLSRPNTQIKRLQLKRKRVLEVLLVSTFQTAKRSITRYSSNQSSENQIEEVYEEKESNYSSPMSTWAILSSFEMIDSISLIEKAILPNPLVSLRSRCIGIMSEILKNSPPLSLAKENPTFVFSIEKNLYKLFSQEKTPLIAESIIAMALQRGKLRHILESLNTILITVPKLDQSSYLQQLDRYRSLQAISILPKCSREINSWNHHSYGSEAANFLNEEIEAYFSSVACDGYFLYILKSSGLLKIGTGLHGTLRGHIYRFNPKFFSNAHGWLIYHKKLLLFRPANICQTDSKIFCYKIYPNSLKESDPIYFNKSYENLERFSHMSSSEDFIYIVDVADKDNGFCGIQTFKIDSENPSYIIPLARVDLSPGVSQFPFKKRLHHIRRKSPIAFHIGQKLLAKDAVGKWCLSSVVEISACRILVHYDGWSSKWDEWFEVDSPRLAPISDSGIGAIDSNSHSIDSQNESLSPVTEACWQFFNGDEWESFPLGLSNEIEAAWKSRKKSIRLMVANHECIFDLINFHRVDTVTSETLRICRKDISQTKSLIEDFFFDDVQFLSTGPYFSFIVPPHCPPNNSHQTLCLSFRKSDGGFFSESYCMPWGGFTPHLTSISFDLLNSSFWSYSPIFNTVFSWKFVDETLLTGDGLFAPITDGNSSIEVSGIRCVKDVLKSLCSLSEEATSQIKDSFSPSTYAPFYLDLHHDSYLGMKHLLQSLIQERNRDNLKNSDDFILSFYYLFKIMYANLNKLSPERITIQDRAIFSELASLLLEISIDKLPELISAWVDVIGLTFSLSISSGEALLSLVETILHSSNHDTLQSQLLTSISYSPILSFAIEKDHIFFKVLNLIATKYLEEMKAASSTSSDFSNSPPVDDLVFTPTAFTLVRLFLLGFSWALCMQQSQTFSENLSSIVIEFYRRASKELGACNLNPHCIQFFTIVTAHISSYISFDPSIFPRALFYFIQQFVSIGKFISTEEPSFSLNFDPSLPEFSMKIMESTHPYTKCLLDESILFSDSIALFIKFDHRCSIHSPQHSLKLIRKSPKLLSVFGGGPSGSAFPTRGVRLKGNEISVFWNVEKEVATNTESDSPNSENPLWGFKFVVCGFAPIIDAICNPAAYAAISIFANIGETLNLYFSPINHRISDYLKPGFRVMQSLKQGQMVCSAPSLDIQSKIMNLQKIGFDHSSACGILEKIDRLIVSCNQRYIELLEFFQINPSPWQRVLKLDAYEKLSYASRDDLESWNVAFGMNSSFVSKFSLHESINSILRIIYYLTCDSEPAVEFSDSTTIMFSSQEKFSEILSNRLLSTFHFLFTSSILCESRMIVEEIIDFFKLSFLLSVDQLRIIILEEDNVATSHVDALSNLSALMSLKSQFAVQLCIEEIENIPSFSAHHLYTISSIQLSHLRFSYSVFLKSLSEKVLERNIYCDTLAFTYLHLLSTVQFLQFKPITLLIDSLIHLLKLAHSYIASKSQLLSWTRLCSSPVDHQCSVLLTGKNYVNMEMYECLTCGLVNGNCCCKACALTCHKGHNCVFKRQSRAFCDCGIMPTCKATSSLREKQRIEYTKRICQWIKIVLNRVILSSTEADTMVDPQLMTMIMLKELASTLTDDEAVFRVISSCFGSYLRSLRDKIVFQESVLQSVETSLVSIFRTITDMNVFLELKSRRAFIHLASQLLRTIDLNSGSAFVSLKKIILEYLSLPIVFLIRFPTQRNSSIFDNDSCVNSCEVEHQSERFRVLLNIPSSVSDFDSFFATFLEVFESEINPEEVDIGTISKIKDTLKSGCSSTILISSKEKCISLAESLAKADFVCTVVPFKSEGISVKNNLLATINPQKENTEKHHLQLSSFSVECIAMLIQHSVDIFNVFADQFNALMKAFATEGQMFLLSTVFRNEILIPELASISTVLVLGGFSSCLPLLGSGVSVEAYGKQSQSSDGFISAVNCSTGKVAISSHDGCISEFELNSLSIQTTNMISKLTSEQSRHLLKTALELVNDSKLFSYDLIPSSFDSYKQYIESSVFFVDLFRVLFLKTLNHLVSKVDIVDHSTSIVCLTFVSRLLDSLTAHKYFRKGCILSEAELHGSWSHFICDKLSRRLPKSNCIESYINCRFKEVDGFIDFDTHLPFFPLQNPCRALPSRLDSQRAKNAIFLDLNCCSVRYIGNSTRQRSGSDDLPLLLLANDSIPSELNEYYFEVEIVSGGSNSSLIDIDIGLCGKRDALEVESIEGWTEDSYCFQCATMSAASYDMAPKSNTYGIHDLVDVLDSVNQWEPARIIDTTTSELKVHYIYWPSRYDEWISRDSDRVLPFRQQSKGYGGQLRRKKYAFVDNVIQQISVGDVVGCLWKSRSGTLEFTLNGQIGGVAFASISNIQFYPSICLREKNCSVKVNFGTEAFKFAWKPSESFQEPVNDQTFTTSNGLSHESLENVLSDDESSRIEMARQIISFGIIPNCSLHCALEALQRNGDNLDLAIAWILENPSRFESSELQGSSAIERHSVILSDSDHEFVLFDDQIGSVVSLPPLYTLNFPPDETYSFESPSSQDQSQGILSSESAIPVFQDQGLFNDFGLEGLDNQSTALGILISQIDLLRRRNVDPSIIQLLEQLRSLNGGESSTLFNALVIPTSSGDSGDNLNSPTSPSSQASFFQHNNDDSSLTSDISSLYLDTLQVGQPVCISASAKKMILDNISLLGNNNSPWKIPMDRFTGKIGKIVSINQQTRSALLEFEDSESSSVSWWWFPLFTLTRAHKVFHNPSHEICLSVHFRLFVNEISEIYFRLVASSSLNLVRSCAKISFDDAYSLVLCPFPISREFDAQTFLPFSEAKESFLKSYALAYPDKFSSSCQQAFKSLSDLMYRSRYLHILPSSFNKSYNSTVLWKQTINIASTGFFLVSLHRDCIIPNELALEFYVCENLTQHGLVKAFTFKLKENIESFIIPGSVMYVVCRALDPGNKNISSKLAVTDIKVLITPIHKNFLHYYSMMPCIIRSNILSSQWISSLCCFVLKTFCADKVKTPSRLRIVMLRFLGHILSFRPEFSIDLSIGELQSLVHEVNQLKLLEEKSTNSRAQSLGFAVDEHTSCIHSNLFHAITEFLVQYRLSMPISQDCTVNFPSWIDELAQFVFILRSVEENEPISLYECLLLSSSTMSSDLFSVFHCELSCLKAVLCASFDDYVRLANSLDQNHGKFGNSFSLISSKELLHLQSQISSELPIFTNSAGLRHISFLIWVNHLAVKVLPLLSFDDSSLRSIWSLGQILAAKRDILFHSTQAGFFKSITALTASTKLKNIPRIKIDRTIAIEPNQSQIGALGTYLKHGYQSNHWIACRNTIFCQLWSQIRDLPDYKLRPKRPRGTTPHVAFIVRFQNEHALGQAGPYRALFSSLSKEMIMTAQYPDFPLQLLLPTPNNVHKVGEDRDMFYVNHSWNSSHQLEMFEFFGKLLGICLRTRLLLPLSLPRLFWKLLTWQSPNLKDFSQVDHLLVHNFLLPIRSHFEKDTFLNIFPEDMVAEFLATIGFSPTCSFSFDDRVEFIDQVTEFLLYRCKPQVDAIRTGMCQVIPHGLLSATSWKSLQILVCGTMDIDVDMLKRHTEYSGTSENAPHIQNFWRVLTEFSPEQRCRFVEFAYAQSRLPSTDEEFAVSPRIRMLIKHKNHPDPDAVFPRADTCFFNVELPAYSSLELMRDRLTRVVSMDWGMSGDDHLELTEVSTFPPGHAITLVSSNASGAAPAEPSNDSSESRALRTRRIRRLDAVRSIRQPLLSPVQRENDPNASPDRIFPPENSEE